MICFTVEKGINFLLFIFIYGGPIPTKIAKSVTASVEKMTVGVVNGAMLRVIIPVRYINEHNEMLLSCSYTGIIP
jgi:hypothetical protein